MTKTFAFTLSVADMVRKLRYRYEAPIDYLASLIEHCYQPSMAVVIDIDETKLHASSTGSIDDLFFKQLKEGRVGALAAALPPVDAYATVEIRSGINALLINEQRSLDVHTDEPQSGTIITIRRKTDETENEEQRLRFIYTGADINVTLNGEQLSTPAFHFEIDEFAGTITYNARSIGNVRFFSSGRYVSAVPLVRGVDVNIHRHPFFPTLTKSRIIMSESGRERFDALLPKIILAYLQSAEAEELRSTAKASYQTLLRVVLERYNMHDAIRTYVEPNLDLEGHRALAEVGRILHIRHVDASPGTTYNYDAGMRTLSVPNSQLLQRKPVEIALGAVPFLEERARLKAYNRIVEAMRS